MDFTDWTCEQLYNFIEDPNNDALDRTAALALWQSSPCATEYPGVHPQSGGGGSGLPPGG